MNRLSRDFNRHLGITLGLMLALALGFAAHLTALRRIDKAGQSLLASQKLAEELKDSSNDLTRMARSYAMTGNPLFKDRYNDLLALRDGRPAPALTLEGWWSVTPRPARENSPLAEVPAVAQLALLQRMRAAGITEDEFNTLAAAKVASDNLVETERESMRLAEAVGPGAERDRKRAQDMLYDAPYHGAKATIMRSIALFSDKVARRTQAEVHAAERSGHVTLTLLLALGGALLLTLLSAYRALRQVLGGSVQSVHAHIGRLGQGDFDTPAPHRDAHPDSVMARLAETQHQLQSLERQRKRDHRSLQLAASVFTHAREGIMITNPGGIILEVNDAFCHITGHSRADVLGQTPKVLQSGRHTPEFYQQFWRQLKTTGHWQGQIWNRRKTGEVYAEMQTISAVFNPQGEVERYVSLFSDITSLKANEERLERIAHFDALTGLPNRLLFQDRLEQAMRHAERRGQTMALVYIDLDGFKSVNDLHGHEAGDQLLCSVSQSMQTALRQGDTLARLGGDEFVALLLDVPDGAGRHGVLERLLASASQPMAYQGHTLQVSASLGVALFPQAQTVNAATLLQQGDEAMYEAKAAGKNQWRLHGDPTPAEAVRSP